MKKRQRSKPVMPTTRREFLSLSAHGTGLVALSAMAPGFLADTVRALGADAADKDGKIIVMIKLAGGCDGLNSVVPVNDDTYYDFRPQISIPKSDTLKIDDDFGFNPTMTGFDKLFKEGDLAIYRDVGYPNSTHSHFSGQDFYERGGGFEFSGSGWLGRFLDAECPPDLAMKSPKPVATHISRYLPITLRSKTPQPIFSMLSSDVKRLMQRAVEEDAAARLLKEVVTTATDEKNEKIKYLNMAYMNAIVTEEKVRDVIANYQPDTEYGDYKLASDMRAVAAMISADMGNRVYSLDLGGFDTHSNHVQRHGELMGEVAGAIESFVTDLKAKKLGDKVIVMPFSEFGRRPYENGSLGTDHGTNSTFFVAGESVKGGLYGTQPTLPPDKRSDIPFTKTSIDFRQMYATVLDKWLGTDADAIMGKSYDRLEFLG